MERGHRPQFGWFAESYFGPGTNDQVRMSLRMGTTPSNEASTSSSLTPDVATIYDTIPIGLAFLSPECRYLQINQRMTEICGIPVADHLGRSVRETLPRLADQVESIVRSVIATGEAITNVEVSGERPDESGAQRFWTTSWEPFKTENGTVIGVNVAAQEITKRKRAEAALEFARASRHTTMGVMTASILHEINQPLTAIAANARAGLRWLSRSPADLAEVRAALDRIDYDARRLGQITTSMRGLFGKNAVERQTFDLNGVVREVLSQVHYDVLARGVTLQALLPNGLPGVMADRIQVQQVVQNLVMNALEAMSEVAGRERALSVKSERRDTDTVLLTLSDTGPGISPEDVDRIFDPFFTTKATGMGLGLAICRSIVTAHGGKLWALPNAPAGAIFHMSLPVVA